MAKSVFCTTTLSTAPHHSYRPGRGCSRSSQQQSHHTGFHPKSVIPLKSRASRKSYLTTVQIQLKSSPGYSIFLWCSTSTSFAKLESRCQCTRQSLQGARFTYRLTPIATAILASWPCSQQTSTLPGPVKALAALAEAWTVWNEHQYSLLQIARQKLRYSGSYHHHDRSWN